MKYMKRFAALLLTLSLSLSLLACGANGELRSAERALKNTPYRISTKTVFRSEDSECAILLSDLNGTGMPLTVDGDRIMASMMTDGYRLTLRFINGNLYYDAVSETGELNLLVRLNKEQEKKFLEDYGRNDRISFSDFSSVTEGDGQGDTLYILNGASGESLTMLKSVVGRALSTVYSGLVHVTGAEMKCRLSNGKFKYITTSVEFEISLDGEMKRAVMTTEESYVYSDSYSIEIPADEYLYEEVEYSEIFGG